jgi:hypothetical protein
VLLKSLSIFISYIRNLSLLLRSTTPATPSSFSSRGYRHSSSIHTRRDLYQRRTLKLVMASPTGLKRNANHLSTPACDAKKPKANGSITSFFGAPKPRPVDAKTLTVSSPSSNFDKNKWVASLTPEQQELLQLEIDTLHESWLSKLKEELVTPEFLGLKRFLKKERESGAKIFPPENEIYSWCDSFLAISSPRRRTRLLIRSTQVSTYTLGQSESGHRRPRSLSQP